MIKLFSLFRALNIVAYSLFVLFISEMKLELLGFALFVGLTLNGIGVLFDFFILTILKLCKISIEKITGFIYSATGILFCLFYIEVMLFLLGKLIGLHSLFELGELFQKENSHSLYNTLGMHLISISSFIFIWTYTRPAVKDSLEKKV